MKLRRRKLRLAAVGALAAVAMVVAACSSSSSPSGSSTAGTAVTGGTASISLPAGVTYSWIYPFYAITNASTYNDNQFQWLMYRPL